MRHTAQKKQRGIALFVSIFALLLLSAVAAGLMFLADTETNINNNYRVGQQASVAAWGGIQEVRERMMLINVAPHLISTTTVPALPTKVPSAANPGSVLYVINSVPGDTVPVPTNAGNKYFDNELCHENFAGLAVGNPGAGVPCAAAPGGGGWSAVMNSDNPFNGTNATPTYKWVRINMKVNNSLDPTGAAGTPQVFPGQPVTTVVCWDGQKEILLPAGNVNCEDPGGKGPQTTVYQLTSLAVTPTGARRMAQMEVAQNPPLTTNAAVDSQDNVVLNGQLTVNGYDTCSCQCVTDKQGNPIGPCSSLPGKTCDTTKWAIYSAGNVQPPGSSETLLAGPNPPYAQNQQWKYDIPTLINNYKTDPTAVNTTQAPYNYSCAGSPLTCGTQPSQTFGVPPNFPPTPPDNPTGPANMASQITYVPGNLQITSSSQGYGILVVDGDLDIHGGMNFYGLILVKGIITFTGGGSDKVNIYGSVLAGQESKVDTKLGGSAVIQYDACALPQGTKNRPPTMISYRDLNY